MRETHHSSPPNADIRSRVALALPKIKLESTYDDNLMSTLVALGMIAPFQSGLCVIEDDCSSFIDTRNADLFLRNIS